MSIRYIYATKVSFCMGKFASFSMRVAHYVGYPFVKLLEFSDFPQKYCYDNRKTDANLSCSFRWTNYRFQFVFINLVLQASTRFVAKCEVHARLVNIACRLRCIVSASELITNSYLKMTQRFKEQNKTKKQMNR